MGAFHTEFPLADHVSIGIDTAEIGDECRAAFEAAGLTVDVATVLTASTLREPRAVEAEVRALEGDDDWEARARLSQQLYPQASEDTLHDLRPAEERPGAAARRRRAAACGSAPSSTARSSRPRASS